MKCPHCGQEHPDDFKFCPISGQPLVPQTKVCGNPDCKYENVPIEAKFCPRCGTPFSTKEQCTFNRLNNANQSQIVIVCSKAGSSIQIGQWLDEGGREKRIRLKKGENTINVEDYPELRYGFSFNDKDRPEHIESIILDEFDTSNVTDMHDMFYGCKSLETLDLSSFDTYDVTSMNHMFFGCSSLEALDLSGFDTFNVDIMDSMFDGCDSLKKIIMKNCDEETIDKISEALEEADIDAKIITD